MKLRILFAMAVWVVIGACDREWLLGRVGDAGGSDASARCGAGDDPDGDFISSIDEGDEDADGDGTPNYLDEDSDGDGILDRVEEGDGTCVSVPVDSDGDGIPDFLDADSDGDSISDADEGREDVDQDEVPAYLDRDSDQDGVDDADEAGDSDLSTPPVECNSEIDPSTGMRVLDGVPDYLDPDSDNDGLSDSDEVTLGTDPCSVDTDGDGQQDIAEGAYERVNCRGLDEPECGCATDPACQIPPEHFYVILQHGGGAVDRDLRFSTSVRVADIFFVIETTRVMASTLTRIVGTVGRPESGLMDRISERIPGAWFGGGQHTDFPFAPYGDATDRLAERAIGMTPQTLPGGAVGSGRAAVAEAFGRMTTSGGGDVASGATESLYQVVVGEGASWSFGATNFDLIGWASSCPDNRWGGGCFREGTLPVVVHFGGACSHAGPPGEPVGRCGPYDGISPRPHGWTQLVTAMSRRGARYIGVNASRWACPAASAPASEGYSPCFFMQRTAEETGSVDSNGRVLVYDHGATESDTDLIDTIVGAIDTLVTQVPFDVDTVIRDDETEGDGVDASHFITGRMPACARPSATEPCWQAPAALPHEEAVASYDNSTFFSVIPGTNLVFSVTFENRDEPGGASVRVFTAYIDIRADGAVILSTRQVYVVVPASSATIII